MASAIVKPAMPAAAALWLADDAVFRRTREGQWELVSESHQLSRQERSFLSSVTGHTPLRVLLDLGLQSAGAGDAICRLVELGMIEFVQERQE